MKLPRFHPVSFFVRHIPLWIVVAIGVTIAGSNIDLTKHYAGWDNILAEFNLIRYARQVFFGAWTEHQGLGAPAAQGQLSEIPRLPILLILKLALPDNLVRYTYILTLFIIGGIGMYFYLAKFWLNQKLNKTKYWLAGLGATLYLLHVLTLQQFYIAFEMFMAQFAFLPFLLIAIHHWITIRQAEPHSLIQKTIQKAKKLKRKLQSSFRIVTHQPVITEHDSQPLFQAVLLFLAVQLLIAPSGHTPTVFYLAVLFSQIYGFFLVLPKGFFKAFKTWFLIGLLTFLFNAYWIVPNVYYTVHNSQYVQESRDNQLFASESVWSIREAGTIQNFLSGTHYLLGWKDYSFADKKFDFIFNEWQAHLSLPAVSILLQSIGVITVLGAGLLIFDKSKGTKRWAILLFYAFCLSFIWIDFFPTRFILDKLYQSGSFTEAFRNPFTKLSILYSFVSILLFIEFFDWVNARVYNRKLSILTGTFSAKLTTVIAIVLLICTAWPSFQGHFLSEKLQIEFPSQYQEMFQYLQRRDRNLRVLQLPQLSHAGWEYYDWQFIKPGNGYQGMGFYFFGFPQPFVNRDSDRWIETSDFFYHELKFALDSGEVDQFLDVMKKYRVDLVIVDETKIDPHRPHNYGRDHLFLTQSGFNPVWSKDFLTIYERPDLGKDQEIFAPPTLTKIYTDSDRVRFDAAYQTYGDYIQTDAEAAEVIYPFTNLTQKQLNPEQVMLTDSEITVTQPIPQGDYTLTLPRSLSQQYFVPTHITYHQQKVTVTFPQNSIVVNDQEVDLPQFQDFEFIVPANLPSLIVFFNNIGIAVHQDEDIRPILSFTVGDPVFVEYSPYPQNLTYTDTGKIDANQLEVTTGFLFTPDWSKITNQVEISTQHADSVTLRSRFPMLSLNLTQNPSVNCSDPKLGTITTLPELDKVIYTAKDFGVNCNGFEFDSESSSYSYIMNVVGKVHQGRGPKFFMNYSDLEVLPEDYLFTEPEFNKFLTFNQISTNTRSDFFLNWETRSLGGTSINELNHIRMIPFPLNQMSTLQLTKTDLPATKQVNPLKVRSHQNFFDFVHLVKTDCQDKCYVALDQSYDDLWLGISLSTSRVLPHYRYNGWGNVWQVPQNDTVIVLYFPEFLAFSGLNILITFAIILAVRSKFI